MSFPHTANDRAGLAPSHRAQLGAILANLRNHPALIAAGVALTDRIIKATNAVLLNKMKALAAALMAGSLSVVLPALILVIVNAVGFTSGGVPAGSLAAAIQSAVYGGLTGGVFSTLQSFGATAVLPPPVVLSFAVTALVAGGGYFAYRKLKVRKGTSNR